MGEVEQHPELLPAEIFSFIPVYQDCTLYHPTNFTIRPPSICTWYRRTSSVVVETPTIINSLTSSSAAVLRPLLSCKKSAANDLPEHRENQLPPPSH
ncbi:hypothetical protein PHAVU_008G027400 [Phaseolus vulgaris]|uniref:Uncharacterized protein n=1 Tax=Phaseolus vulgaris TaxID=3885 RepID=V7B0I9_PHAVU|nr:hypothetical protein PHAVU_008G027400g [Phaseolus vulgaris]ESW11407.1 hypothetical protein PHAVU_008G027400g [Phaseolus vulgaris]